MIRTVVMSGLGVIGLPLARALDEGISGLRLIAVGARDPGAASGRIAGFRNPPQIVDLAGLAARHRFYAQGS
jgi:aspartate dehydrogenase